MNGDMNEIKSVPKMRNSRASQTSAADGAQQNKTMMPESVERPSGRAPEKPSTIVTGLDHMGCEPEQQLARASSLTPQQHV
jgi:hypothetical protein